MNDIISDRCHGHLWNIHLDNRHAKHQCLIADSMTSDLEQLPPVVSSRTNGFRLLKHWRFSPVSLSAGAYIRSEGMFFALHLPIGDYRSFEASAPQRLAQPFWPVPEPYREFIRNFGNIVERRSDLVESGIRGNAQFFCNSRRAVRLMGLRRDIPRTLANLDIQKVFRHFIIENEITTHFNVSFAFNYNTNPTREIDIDTLNSIMKLDVKIPLSTDSAKNVPLYNIGKRIADLYNRVSIQHTPDERVALSRKLVIPETPIIVVESTGLPSHMGPIRTYRCGEIVSESGETTLEYVYFNSKIGGRSIPVWIITAKGKRRRITREVHAGIVKIYTDYAILRRVLQLLLNNKVDFKAGSPCGEKIECYLNTTTSKIKRQFVENCDQESLRMIMELYSACVNPGMLDRYATLLMEMRRQVRKKVIDFISGSLSGRDQSPTNRGGITIVNNYINYGHNNVFHGDIAAGNMIKDSYNSASASGDQELKSHLTGLVDLVAQLAENMDNADDQRRVSSKVKALVEEAKSSKPDKGFLAVTAEGLIEAAKTVAAMAGPITISVKALMGLFGIKL